MKSLTIVGRVRETLGKKDAKKLRTKELVPAVLYGAEEVVHFYVSFSDLRHLMYTPNVYIIDLEVDDKKYKTMIQDVQWHPVNEQVLHIDFLNLLPDKPVKIAIPVKVKGVAKGAKAGGRLKVSLRKLRVKALLEHLPDTIDIDVTKLEIGDSIKVGDIKRDNLEFIDHKSNLVVGVVSTRVSKSVDLGLEDEEEEGEEESTEEGAAEATE